VTKQAAVVSSVWVLDTMILSHFARAERLDVFRDLLVDKECWTTQVVLEEVGPRGRVPGRQAIRTRRRKSNRCAARNRAQAALYGWRVSRLRARLWAHVGVPSDRYP
jgi:hypothetical protein